MKYKLEINNVKKAVKESINLSEVLEKLNIPRNGNNSATLRKYLDNNNIDYSHFTGRSRVYRTEEIDIKEYLENKRYITSAALKKKLFKEHIKENKCEICGITEWNNKPIICQLHHKDGNHLNNNLENLQILCPNCHSQTDNYCGNSNKVTKKKYYCENCGKEKSTNSKYCSVCSSLFRRKVERPTLEQLNKDFKELKTFVAVGKKYNVSDNTIRKWLKL